MRSPCPTFEDLSLAFSAGDPGDCAEHLEACTACLALWRDLERLKLAGQSLPWTPPSPERATDLEAELVLRARYAVPPLRRWRAIAAASAAVAIAASVALFVVWEDRETVPPTAPEASSIASSAVPAPGAPLGASSAIPGGRRGTLRASTGARLEHYTRHDTVPGLSDEIVRVAAGTVDVEVQPLAPDERFRVVTADAEIEVRGTAFEVEVEGDRLRAVHVQSGVVEVRPKSGPPRLLKKGDSWSADEPANLAEATAIAEHADGTSSAPARQDVGSRPRAEPKKPLPARDVVRPRPEPEAAPAVDSSALPKPAEAVPEHDTAERLFAEGWTALQRGEASYAADRFAELLARAPDGSLAEDAAYWRAVALAKAEHPGTDAAMREFRSRFPQSARGAQVALMLGWRFLARGDLTEAERSFTAARDEGSGEVRAKAEQGLALVARGGK